MHEQCALVQSVTAEDRPNVNLVVIVLKTADGKNRLLRVIAPLGVLLPSGLGLKIDDTDVGRAGFVRCLPTGCVAEVVMEDKLIQSLKNGHNATHIHHLPDARRRNWDSVQPQRLRRRI
jgi:invasion protein IalB